eukprot:gene17184-20473_t
MKSNVFYFPAIAKALKGVNNTMWITGYGFPQESLLVLDKSSARIKPIFLDDKRIQFPLGQIDLGNSTHTIQVVTESGWGSQHLDRQLCKHTHQSSTNARRVPSSTYLCPKPEGQQSQSQPTTIVCQVPPGSGHNLTMTFVVKGMQPVIFPGVFSYNTPTIQSSTINSSNVVIEGQNFGSDPSFVSVRLCNETIADFTLTSHQQIHFSIPPLVKNTCPLEIQVANQSTIYEKSIIPPIIMSTSNISVDGGHFFLQGMYFNDPVQVAIGSNICFNLTMTRKGALQDIMLL